MNRKIIKAYAQMKAGLGGEKLLEEYIAEELNIPYGLDSIYSLVTTKINNIYGVGLTDEQYRNLIYLELLNQLEEEK